MAFDPDKQGPLTPPAAKAALRNLERVTKNFDRLSDADKKWAVELFSFLAPIAFFDEA